MAPLSGLYGYASGGAAWQDKGYFFVREKAVAYAFDKGSTSARQIPIARSGAYIKDIFRAGGQWLILRDTSNRYYLFSLSAISDNVLICLLPASSPNNFLTEQIS